MNFLKWITKHIIILIVGIGLAFFVARIQYGTKDLSASVLSLTEQDFFEATARDAWYKKSDQIFEIFLSENVRNEWPLTASILFSPENIELSTDQIETPYEISFSNQDKWNLILNINWYENWDFSEWIFQLPYNWDYEDITLEYVKSKNLNFSIWSLDNIDHNDQTH